MIRPLPSYRQHDELHPVEAAPRSLPLLDRAFDAVERALRGLGIDDPQSLRSPRPVEEALRATALPEGTMLVLDEDELRAAERDIEETVCDERLGGSVFVTLPTGGDLSERARGLRDLGHTAATFGFNPSLRPLPATRLGKVRQIPLPLHLRSYRFLCADTPGFRAMAITRARPGGGFIALWTGNEHLIDELRGVVGEAAEASGYIVPAPAATVPPLEGVDEPADVWRHAETLRAYRVVREAELREIARQAALRGVQLRREREAAKRDTKQATSASSKRTS